MGLFKRAIRRSSRDLRIAVRKAKARKMGLESVPPNFIFFPRFNERSVIIDGGCGYLAELSNYLIDKYGLTAFGVDPTHKHAASLKRIEERTNGRFRYLRLAIAADDGFQTFFESREMESGSLFTDHTNVRGSETISYVAEAVSVRSLIRRTRTEAVDLLKLDLEGAEYEIFEGIDVADLGPFGQIFIEFHHHALRRFTKDDTRRIVEKLCHGGLKTFTLDDHNYLFYRA